MIAGTIRFPSMTLPIAISSSPSPPLLCFAFVSSTSPPLLCFAFVFHLSSFSLDFVFYLASSILLYYLLTIAKFQHLKSHFFVHSQWKGRWHSRSKLKRQNRASDCSVSDCPLSCFIHIIFELNFSLSHWVHWFFFFMYHVYLF